MASVTCSSSAAAAIRCACGSTRKRSPHAGSPRATSPMRSASRTCRSPQVSSARRRHRINPMVRGRRTSRSRSTRKGVSSTRRTSPTSSSARASMARSHACATSHASNSAPTTTRCAPCSITRRRSASAYSSVPAATRSRSQTPCGRRWPSSRNRFPTGSNTTPPMTPRYSCAARSKPCRTHCSRRSHSSSSS